MQGYIIRYMQGCISARVHIRFLGLAFGVEDFFKIADPFFKARKLHGDSSIGRDSKGGRKVGRGLKLGAQKC